MPARREPDVGRPDYARLREIEAEVEALRAAGEWPDPRCPPREHYARLFPIAFVAAAGRPELLYFICPKGLGDEGLAEDLSRDGSG